MTTKLMSVGSTSGSHWSGGHWFWANRTKKGRLKSQLEDDQRARAISERTRDIVHWWTSVLLTQELLAFGINMVLVSMPLKDMVRTPLIISSPLMWTIKNSASTCEKWEWNSTKFLYPYGPCPNAQGVLMHFKINSRMKAIGKQSYGLWVKSTWLVILRSMT